MLNLRARQLVCRRARRGLARSLRDVVAYVDDDGSRRAFSTVAIRRGAVRADREAIVGLAERLETAAPVSAGGMVLASALLTDGVGSPLFNRYCGLTVAEAVWAVAEALAGGAPASVFDVD